MITLFFAFIFVLEAYHDYHLIRSVRVNGIDRDNKKMHLFNFWMWGVTMLFVTLSTWNLFPLVAAVVCRLFFLQYCLNTLRRTDVYHLGNDFIDYWCKRILGKFLTFWLKFALLAAIFIYEILHYESITKKIFFHLLPH